MKNLILTAFFIAVAVSLPVPAQELGPHPEDELNSAIGRAETARSRAVDF